MKRLAAALIVMLLSAMPTALPRDYAIRAVPMTAVTIRSRFRADLLNGVEVISGAGSRAFMAIPYYAWNNRGQGEMAVWIREKP